MVQVVQKDSVKNLYAKGWFLTYPQCPVKKEDALTILQTNDLPAEIEEYLIAEETHKDGSPHLHIFLKMSKRLRFKQIVKKFDLLEYHGHYEPAKSWRAVEKYCSKEGNYITNINVEAAKNHKAKKIKPEDFLRDPLELMEEGVLNPMSLNNFIKNRDVYKMLLNQKRLREIPKDIEKQRHHWIYGGSNSGKTTYIRKMIIENPDDWFQIPYNGDWKGYNGQKNLYADEYKGQLTIQEINRICDGGAKVNTKGGSTQLAWDVIVWIISNYPYDKVYKMDRVQLDSFDNRFKLNEFIYNPDYENIINKNK